MSLFNSLRHSLSKLVKAFNRKSYRLSNSKKTNLPISHIRCRKTNFRQLIVGFLNLALSQIMCRIV